MVVDDDTVSRHVLTQALTGAGLAWMAVSSGAEGLRAIEQERPSLVLLDLIMPSLDGYQLLRILRARAETRDLPVVVLTSLDAEDEIARAFEAGADDFLRKPFKAVELVSRVRGQLRLRSAMVELARKERDAKVVLELTQALASNLDFRGILFTVVQRIAQVAEVDRVSIVLVRDQDKVGYVVAASDDQQLRDLPIDLAKYPEFKSVLETGATLVIPDASTHPVFEIFRGEGPPHVFSSLAIVPILYEGRAMGVLSLRSRGKGDFGERQLAMCRTISSAMAIALRNARVLQTLRDETQQVTVARFEAERRMRSLQRYADFFESSGDGIVVVDAEGRMHFSNPRAREITGYSEEDLQGKRLQDFFVDRGVAEELTANFAEGTVQRRGDIRFSRKDRRVIVLSATFSSVLREEGAVLCSFRDVTQDRAMKAELVKTKDFLQRVIDSSVDAIITADLRGKIVLFNRAAERIYGCSAEEVVGRRVTGFYPKGGAVRIMKMIRAGGGRVQGVRIEMLDATGAVIPVLFSGALIYEGDSPVGTVGLFTDLREKIQMEARLQKAQEQLLAQERQAIVAELAGAAAHELNQPLTSVLNYAILLKRLLTAPSPPFSAAEIIASEAERMAEIVRKIGKITRYETKSYVGKQNILDLDRSSDSRSGDSERAPKP